MKQIAICIVAALSLLSCQKIDLDDQQSEDGKVNVSISIGSIEQIPFENTTTRASISDLCSRFTVAFFQEGTKVKTVSQTSEDESFGTVSLSLEPGTYQLVAIAHNGLGNCTVTSPERISFYNNKMTDTFCYYGDLTVSEAVAQSVALKRAVAMFRLNITDNMPSDVAQMKFYYTGGSSTFNAVTGFGCVNSKQTEIFNVSESDYGKPSVFEIYSFPHEETDNLKITVTALDLQGNGITEKTYSDMPIKQNVITQHSDAFFSSFTNSVSVDNTFSIENDGKWTETMDK